jgi:lactoylglutathione lyase
VNCKFQPKETLDVTSTLSAMDRVAAVAPKITQSGHIGLNVSDLDRAKDFYLKVFGLQILHEHDDRDRRFAFLGEGERLVLTLWQQAAGRFDPGRSGLHHLSFQVANLEELKAVQARLEDLNIGVLHGGIVAHMEGSPSGAVFFEDPDGIRLEVFSPSGASGYQPATKEGPSCGFF